MSEQPSAAGSGAAASLDEQRPWLGHYPAGVPAEITVPNASLVDIFLETVEQFPDRVAGIFYGNKITYRELDLASNQFANRLLELGHQPGRPVLVILPNCPQFLISAYGILKAGGVIAGLNPLLIEPEIAALAEDSGARIAITLDRFWDRVAPIQERGVLDSVISTSIQDGLPRLKRWLFPLKYRKDLVDVPHAPERGIYQFRELLADAPDTPPGISVASNHMAVFQYTGGTTGLPKAAVLTHRNLVANSVQIRAWIPDLRVGGESIMAILPFFHAYGGTLGLFLGVRLAATLVMVPRFDIKDVMEQIEKHHPTVLPGVPTLYNALNGAVQESNKRQAALRSIRYCISGGAPLPAEVRARFEEITGGSLVEGYGLSEASPVTHINPLDGRARNGTVGLPISSTEVMLVDPDTKAPLPLDARGEIAIRGPQVMQGYWGKADDTAEVLSRDGWLYTGDIGEVDADGFFSIVDRRKDVIITGGENLYPREIEEVLYQHPKIHEVCVAGIPHHAGGEVAKAFIVLKPGETLERREVIQFASGKIARYKVPRQIEFRDELPKSATGKILRRELQEQELARIQRVEKASGE